MDLSQNSFGVTIYIRSYGGEEFCVITPGAPATVAFKKAKQLCKEQRKMAYSIDAASQVTFTVRPWG